MVRNRTPSSPIWHVVFLVFAILLVMLFKAYRQQLNAMIQKHTGTDIAGTAALRSSKLHSWMGLTGNVGFNATSAEASSGSQVRTTTDKEASDGGRPRCLFGPAPAVP